MKPALIDSLADCLKISAVIAVGSVFIGAVFAYYF